MKERSEGELGGGNEKTNESRCFVSEDHSIGGKDMEGKGDKRKRTKGKVSIVGWC